MLDRLTAGAAVLLRLAASAVGRLLGPDDGIAPTGSGAVQVPIASMPESSGPRYPSPRPATGGRAVPA